MRRKIWPLAAGFLLFISFMVVLTPAIQTSHPITELYVFGDSLSDMGNGLRATGGLYPPSPTYFKGRFSNGRVWVEYLADRLRLSSSKITNLAYGGATTGATQNSFVPSLLTQVQSFTQTHRQVNPDALYVLWAGSNDYLQGISSATVPVENVTQSIVGLADVGAKRFLVANLPDLGQLPATRSSTSSTSLSTLTQSHNQSLRRSLKQLNQQRPELQIVTLDANTLYREAVTSPAAFGFSNVISGCLSGSQPCPQPDRFLFWDGIHPTTAAHRHLGEAAFSVIQNAGMVASAH